jgi:hypothetical protein
MIKEEKPTAFQKYTPIKRAAMLQSGTFLQYGTYKDISKKYHPQSFIIHH